mgnify:CR=1 FL=1
MFLLLKNVRIFDGKNESRVQDIAIRDGVIESVGKNLPVEKDAQVWESGTGTAAVSPGWLDVGIHAGDPGFEHLEDLHSAAQAAAAGGRPRLLHL